MRPVAELLAPGVAEPLMRVILFNDVTPTIGDNLNIWGHVLGACPA
jgi:hypothetical protein